MTPALETRMLGASRDAIAEAARALISGGLVAFPTETVYGLGADATDGKAVARLYAAKGRPPFNPLIAHVPGAEAAQQLAVFNDAARQLARTFWPGPLTLVLDKQPCCPVADLATAGLDTIAVRAPDHAVARDLLLATGRPVVAPSANRSGHVSPTSAAHVLADLRGRIDLIVDGGPTRIGVESTIVACHGARPVLLRPGGVPRSAIEAVLGGPLAGPDSVDVNAPSAPGMMESHYAPRARIRLDAREVHAGEALLSFGPRPPAGADLASRELNLSQSGDPIEAAANLFSHLRTLDSAGAGTIAVMPIPQDGLGEAINDRLSRAAAPRA